MKFSLLSSLLLFISFVSSRSIRLIRFPSRFIYIQPNKSQFAIIKPSLKERNTIQLFGPPYKTTQTPERKDSRKSSQMHHPAVYSPPPETLYVQFYDPWARDEFSPTQMKLATATPG